MQETAVVLLRKFDATMDDQAFARWAFGVARMEVLTFRRDRARDRHRFGEEVFELLAQSTSNIEKRCRKNGMRWSYVLKNSCQSNVNCCPMHIVLRRTSTN